MRRLVMVVGVVLVAAGCTQGKTAPTCPPGQTMCGNACASTRRDPENCGACGKTCATGEVCSQGACMVACPAGLVDCGGRCVDPMTNPAYCGASADCQGQNAGTACTGGEVCSQGACAVSCQAGDLACGASCVDPATSTSFCGASADCTGANAGTACAAGQLCLAGHCVGNDASLSGLAVSGGTLSPGFDPGSLLYVATVSNAFPSITVTPTATSPDATVTVNGTPVDSGSPSAPIPLSVKVQTPISVVVTAPGGATETYGLVVMRRGAHYLKASDTAANAIFGTAMSLDGDTLVVGAPGRANSAGAAYVFTRDASGTWSQQAILEASNPDANDSFGQSVAVSGDTVVVGAYDEASQATGVDGDQTDNSDTNAGAAYVFVRDATGHWSQQAYLKPSNTRSYDDFGRSVAVSGDTVVVGADGEWSKATGVNGDQTDTSASNAGAAYVFVRDGTGSWSQQAYLKASNTDASDHFGRAVAISGDTVVVGASQEASHATGVDGDQTDNSASKAGAAYVFVRDATGSWSQQAYLKASNTDAQDYFGKRVGISGDTVVVGAVGESSNATGVNGDQTDNSAFSAGAAYVFVRDASGTWSQQAYLKASNAEANDAFGRSVAVSGNTVVVGADGEASQATGVNGDQADNSAFQAGAAYVFVRDATGTWSQQAYLKASNTDGSDHFGGSVGVSGDAVVVGASGERSQATGVDGDQADNSAYSAGAAYVY